MQKKKQRLQKAVFLEDKAPAEKILPKEVTRKETETEDAADSAVLTGMRIRQFPAIMSREEMLPLQKHIQLRKRKVLFQY